MKILYLHHIAIICSDYFRSKKFYVDILGLKIINEVFRKNRNSYKLDLALNEHYLIELFSFNDPPKRISFPEACGLRHLCFAVENLQKTRNYLIEQNVIVEEIRIDQLTQKSFFFCFDPDNLPIEFYEAN